MSMKRKHIGLRLKTARQESGLTRKRVIELAGIGSTTLQQWEVGAREASIETIESLAKLYGTTPQYLIFGDDKETSLAHSVVTDDSYAYISFYDIEASAGHGSFTDGTVAHTRQLAFEHKWLQDRNLRTKDLSAIVASGDSMEPTIHDNATIIIDHSRNEPRDGKIYVVRINDRLWVKRVQWHVNGGLRLISDNKIYDTMDITPEDLKREDIEVIGQVIHTAYDLVI